MFYDNLNTTSKQIVWILLINSILWIWCSYVLAFMDKGQIAEALSSNVCTVVIGQVVMYFLTKTVENVFKHNDFKYTGKSIINEGGNDNELGASGTEDQTAGGADVVYDEPEYYNENVDPSILG